MPLTRRVGTTDRPVNIFRYVKNTSGNIVPTEVYNIYKKVDGVLKPIWKYSWVASDWGNCSAKCGGGTQTRTVKCTRNDGKAKDDIFCSNVTKPALSQACNTHNCTSLNLRYIEWVCGRNSNCDRKDLLGTFTSDGTLGWYGTGTDMHGGTLAYRIWVNNTLIWQSANYSYISGHKWDIKNIGWLSVKLKGPPYGDLYMSGYITSFGNCCRSIRANQMYWTPA